MLGCTETYKFQLNLSFSFCIILLGSDNPHRLFRTEILAKTLSLPTHLMTIFCFARGQDFTLSYFTWWSGSGRAVWKTNCYWQGWGQAMDVKTILRLCTIFDLITKPQATAQQTSITSSLTFCTSLFNLLLRSLQLILHGTLSKVLG